MTCIFNKAWVGRCGNETLPNSLYSSFCQEHAGKSCSSCGAQATHECGETGQFVCGALLCNDCEHAIAPDGTNGGVGFLSTVPEDMKPWKTHVKKTEQRFKPWYEREL